MTPDYDSHLSSCSFEVAAATRKCERLKARAVRWAKLCDELSARAGELKSLREELEPIEKQQYAQRNQLDNHARELQEREAEIERRWQALEFTLQKQIRSKDKQSCETTDKLDMFAELKKLAGDFNHGTTEYLQQVWELADQLDLCDRELGELGQELATVQLNLSYE